MTHSISIIVIVKNDRSVADTLAALRTQEKPAETEIMVVDASHPDMMKDIRDLYSEVTWVQFEPKIKNKTSIPEQRNFGVARARGSIIVFTDASCIPVDGWLKKVTIPILNGEESVTAGPFGVNATHRGLVEHDATQAHTYLSCSGTGNLAFLKDVWKEVGGFDETFLYGSDVDFTWRCVDAGYRIRFIPDAGVSHDWGTALEDSRRSFKYGKARADLFIKHPHRVIKQLTGEAILLVVYSIWILGLPLTFFIPWYPLTIGLLILKNLRHKPFITVWMNLVYTLGFYRQMLRRIVGR